MTRKDKYWLEYPIFAEKSGSLEAPCFQCDFARQEERDSIVVDFQKGCLFELLRVDLRCIHLICIYHGTPTQSHMLIIIIMCMEIKEDAIRVKPKLTAVYLLE